MVNEVDALMFPRVVPRHGVNAMDDALAYDTLLVAWVLGAAMFSFLLGRALGASGWPGGDRSG